MRMLIATGGTGGHIYPALALADAAKERYGDIEILFVGNDDRMEASEVPSHGYAFQGQMCIRDRNHIADAAASAPPVYRRTRCVPC